VVLSDVKIGSNVVLKHAVIDRRCEIPDGTLIGVSPEQDRKRFRVTNKGIVLVTPKMLGQRLFAIR
jgi:glucose-1-phosphate adenylyltransferase